MKLKFLNYFMSNAFSAAQLSTCPRASVGAIIVSAVGKIVGTGYNGAPRGVPHCEDVGCILDGNDSCAMSVHAEVNALLGLSTSELLKSTLFCTHRPCFNCTKIILNSGIVAVYYAKDYDSGPFADQLLEYAKGRVSFKKLKVQNGQTS